MLSYGITGIIAKYMLRTKYKMDDSVKKIIDDKIKINNRGIFNKSSDCVSNLYMLLDLRKYNGVSSFYICSQKKYNDFEFDKCKFDYYDMTLNRCNTYNYELINKFLNLVEHNIEHYDDIVFNYVIKIINNYQKIKEGTINKHLRHYYGDIYEEYEGINKKFYSILKIIHCKIYNKTEERPFVKKLNRSKSERAVGYLLKTYPEQVSVDILTNPTQTAAKWILRTFSQYINTFSEEPSEYEEFLYLMLKNKNNFVVRFAKRKLKAIDKEIPPTTKTNEDEKYYYIYDKDLLNITVSKESWHRVSSNGEIKKLSRILII